jgi:hypothetical protein
MARWVALTDPDHGQIYLNLDNALRIMPYGEDGALIGFPDATGIHNVIVRESPAQIVELAKQPAP